MLRLLSWLGKPWQCKLGRHHLTLSAEPGRLALKCMDCPYETPGWVIAERRKEKAAA